MQKQMILYYKPIINVNKPEQDINQLRIDV
jgi:hypothetical protein